MLSVRLMIMTAFLLMSIPSQTTTANEECSPNDDKTCTTQPNEDSTTIPTTWQTKYDKLSSSFHPRVGSERVEIRYAGAEFGGGLFATKDIPEGEIVVQMESSDFIDAKLADDMFPDLRDLVERAVGEIDDDGDGVDDGVSVLPIVEEVMSSIVLLMEWSKGSESRWSAYIEALPASYNDSAYYWSDDEMKCVVPRPKEWDAFKKRLTLSNYRKVIQKLTTSIPFQPLINLQTTHATDNIPLQAEWSYMVVKDRAFNTGQLRPIIDMANHNPLLSTPPYEHDSPTLVSIVSTHPIKKGDQIFLDYGHQLHAASLTEQYGFTNKSVSATVNVPSMTADILNSSIKDPRFLQMCHQGSNLFFGDVPEGRVQSSRGNILISTTYYKPFRPAQLIYQCLRVVLQTEDGEELGRYVKEKVEGDIEVYRDVLEKEECGGEEGNFGLIRDMNRVVMELLEGVRDVAEMAEGWETEYPDVPYP